MKTTKLTQEELEEKLSKLICSETAGEDFVDLMMKVIEENEK